MTVKLKLHLARRRASMSRLFPLVTIIVVLVLYLWHVALFDANPRANSSTAYLLVFKRQARPPESKATSYEELRSASRSFLITVLSIEQLTRQLFSYVDLCRIALDWQSTLVEPFVCGSRLYGIPGYKDSLCLSEEKMLPYGTVFSMEQLKQAALCHNGCDVEKWSTFMKLSYRQIILVMTLKIVRSDQVEPIWDCTATFNSTATELENYLNNGGHEFKPFSIQSVLCWHTSTPTISNTLMTAMNSLVSQKENYQFSILLYSYIKSGLYNPDGRPKLLSLNPEQKECADYLRRGPTLLDNTTPSASQFTADLGVQGNYIGIHVRIEELIRLSNKEVECCLNTINSVKKEVLIATQEDIKVLLFTDVSPSGTDSCLHKCPQKLNTVVAALKKITSLTPAYINPKKYNITRTSASFIEHEVLGHSKKLIVVGGGVFQQTIVEKFLSHHDLQNDSSKHENYKDHLYSICRLPQLYNSIPSLEWKGSFHNSCLRRIEAK